MEARSEAPPAPAEKPNGPVAAAMLATGIGSFVLGVLTTWSAASEGFASDLEFSTRVGPLSGKTIVTVIVFVVAWIGLGVALRDRDVDWKPVTVATVALIALGVLGTFPTFFQAFAPAE